MTDRQKNMYTECVYYALIKHIKIVRRSCTSRDNWGKTKKSKGQQRPTHTVETLCDVAWQHKQNYNKIQIKEHKLNLAVEA